MAKDGKDIPVWPPCSRWGLTTSHGVGGLPPQRNSVNSLLSVTKNVSGKSRVTYAVTVVVAGTRARAARYCLWMCHGEVTP